MGKSVEEYLSKMEEYIKEIRQKQIVMFIEMLRGRAESKVGWISSEIAFSLGVTGLGIAILALGINTKDIYLDILGIFTIVYSMVHLGITQRKIRNMEKSFETTSEAIRELVKEFEDSF